MELYWENGKENGSYRDYRDYIGSCIGVILRVRVFGSHLGTRLGSSTYYGNHQVELESSKVQKWA